MIKLGKSITKYDLFPVIGICRHQDKLIQPYIGQKWKLNRIFCLLMQRQIQKGHCAYAKVGKSKPKIKSQVPQSARSKKGQNIYDQLMGELDAEQSDYINRLCKKNEQKMKKSQPNNPFECKQQQFKDVANILNAFSQKQLKKNTKRQVSNKASKQNISSTSSLNVSYRQVRPRYENTLQLQSKIEDNSNSSQSQEHHQYFINSLDQYITKLRQSQYKNTPPQSFLQKQKIAYSQSQNDRSFRRTVEVSSKSKKSPEEFISKAKYSKLLDKLQEQIYEKEGLIYKLQSKQIKMENMKKIMKQMHDQILGLQRQLRVQRQQKNKYSQMAQEFVHKLHETRSKSKEKHYIPQHLKRNSHIPSSSNLNSNDFNEYLNRTGTAFANLGYVGKCRQKQQVSTLKKKGMHRYKISEIQVDANQSFQASIYHDSY